MNIVLIYQDCWDKKPEKVRKEAYRTMLRRLAAPGRHAGKNNKPTHHE